MGAKLSAMLGSFRKLSHDVLPLPEGDRRGATRSPWLAAGALMLMASSALAQPPSASSGRQPAFDRAAPEAEPEDAAALRDRGNTAMLAMRYADALDLYRRASALAPDQVGLHYSMARAHQFLGEYPEALAALELFVRRASADDLAKVGPLDVLFAELRPRVSALSLRCTVDGARVIVGDKIVGVTPIAGLPLPAGAATVQVELDGFFTERRDVVLPGGGSLALEVELHPKRTSALLTVSTWPPAAKVFVDGHYLGTSTPKVELAVTAGPHDVVARLEGYDEARVPFIVQPGTTREVSMPLQKSVPVTSRWWFWTGLGAVVAGGIGTAVALTTERSPGRGTLMPGRIVGP
jgi:hypothetical protein